MTASALDHTGVAEGQLLWTPSQQWVEGSALYAFMAWLTKERGIAVADYSALWSWSVAEPDAFWRAIWDYFEVDADGALTSVLVAPDGFFGARWFEGVRTNYAEHLLRFERRAAPGATALVHASETRPAAEMSWQELGGRVRALATGLRRLGVEPGDRVASYMPNIAETAVAMLATVAIGAIWSSTAPEFGAKTVIDRLGQIEPKVIFAVDGYSFGATVHDRRAELVKIAAELPSLEHVIWLPYLALGECPTGAYEISLFEELANSPADSAQDFRYERVPADHPLWVLFSSGTTGPPKAIVHGHAAMIVEQLKTAALHCNLAPGKRVFFYTTAGWMMWNSLVAALIVGGCPVLYDGSPTFRGPDWLWRLAAETRATQVGASPMLVQLMGRAGVVPKDLVDVSTIDTIILGGAPSTPETFKWFYDNLHSDLFVVSTSGGTELASGLVGGVPIQPVYAGEIQGRALGIAVDVWNEAGEPVADEIGELVVTAPFPTAPLRFWNDPGDERYHASYFSTFPGVWRHGDLAKINTRGGVYVYGRSDATLNRFGVRIGTAEIYDILRDVPEVEDGLIVCCETAGGGSYMPLFVTLRSGSLLDDELRDRINRDLRSKASPRHTPDEINAAPGIPYTLTGKKMEVPVRKLITGVALSEAASRDATTRPDLLEWYSAFGRARVETA